MDTSMLLIVVNCGNIEINNSRFQKISGKRTALKLTKSQLEIAKKKLWAEFSSNCTNFWSRCHSQISLKMTFIVFSLAFMKIRKLKSLQKTSILDIFTITLRHFHYVSHSVFYPHYGDKIVSKMSLWFFYQHRQTGIRERSIGIFTAITCTEPWWKTGWKSVG